MDRTVCIHGHFYQPPRENAWLECIQVQPSAAPFHDWNARVTAECYRPNTASRILDAQGAITAIVNNYANISFDFGPTVLSWMEDQAADTYAAILAADRESQVRFGGHGSAIAQVYNHMIMPLTHPRDKETQVLWGIADFRHRFGRDPESMWLPETAVDVDTLELLAAHSIAFVILAPHQARHVRSIGTRRWNELAPGSIDSRQSYLVRLPSGQTIAAFFYDGALAHDLAFGDLLRDGVQLAAHLVAPFEGTKNAGLVHLATDGETFGHHHRFGEMGLAYALAEIAKRHEFRLTNYGQFLEQQPPTLEVEIVDNTSWSCSHGVERWRSDCGCNAGSHAGWHQRWRQPLREALDWLRDCMADCFRKAAAGVLRDPWAARNDYIAVILDRSPESVQAFFERNAGRESGEAARLRALRLLEMQRHAQLMYTSCGWFFDDISGIESVQVLQYAARAVELCRQACGSDLEPEFKKRLQAAPSNHSDTPTGLEVYERFVLPSRVDAAHLAANFGMRLVTGQDGGAARSCIGAFEFGISSHRRASDDGLQLDVGQLHVTSTITLETSKFALAALNTGDDAAVVGVREIGSGSDTQHAGANPLVDALAGGKVAAREALAAEFGTHLFFWTDLLPDERIRFVRWAESLADTENSHVGECTLYQRFGGLLQWLRRQSEPEPPQLRAAVERGLRHTLLTALRAESVNLEVLEFAAVQSGDLNLHAADKEILAAANDALRRAAERVRSQPGDLHALVYAMRLVRAVRTISADVDLWYLQNAVFSLLQSRPEIVRSQRAAIASLVHELHIAVPAHEEGKVASPVRDDHPTPTAVPSIEPEAHHDAPPATTSEGRDEAEVGSEVRERKPSQSGQRHR